MKQSAISQTEFPDNACIHTQYVRPEILALIRRDHPQVGESGFITLDELNQYRRIYLSSLIADEKGELAELDHEVIEAFKNNTILSERMGDDETEDTTFGQRIADKIAVFGGSWTFIISFFTFILLWIGFNVWILASGAFDPFPFILLNLILSCLASIQAPIIMMSQNRQEQKDRSRSEHDYKINMKAELEIKLLNEKIDHLVVHQNKRLLEIQELQTDYLQDLLDEIKKRNNP
jgi:uncharacterized membrane protein